MPLLMPPRLKSLVSSVLLGLMLLAAAGCAKSEGPVFDQAQVEQFLHRYFSTWSEADFEGYGACFDPAARVYFVDPKGAMTSQGLTDFLHGQRLSQEQNRAQEKPTSMQLSGDARVVQARVRWLLQASSRQVSGSDYFTLVASEKGWRIASLVFYND